MDAKLGTEGKYALKTTNKSQGMVKRQGRSEMGSAYGYGGPPCVVCMHVEIGPCVANVCM